METNQATNPFTGRICPRGASGYVWKSGDTVASVASANGITAQSLSDANPGVNFATVAAGDFICLPASVITCAGGTLYQIKAGDTYQKIAAAYGVTVAALTQQNPNVSPTNLQIGEYICIPGATPSEPSTGPSCPVGYTAKQVTSGQTYADLLIANNVSYRAMRLSNPFLIPGQLTVGQSYCAPPNGTRRLCSTSTYVLLAGENLASVAAKLNTTQGQLLRANMNLAPSDFTAGQSICIPE